MIQYKEENDRSVRVICCWSPSHIGETLITNYLRHHLSCGSVVLANYYLRNRRGTLEIDHVVINHNGVYLLEGKHWRKIDADQLHWRNRHGELIKSPIIGIEYRVRVMYGFLKRQGWGHVSVVGLVVLSRKPDEFKCTDPNAHKVFELDESLIKALSGREYVFRPRSPTLSSDEIDRLRKVILDSHIAEAERLVAGYRVLSQRDRGYYIDVEGKDPKFPEHKVRIKQYDVPEVGSTAEIEEAVWRFRRDMEALVRAGPHPNLLMPHRFHCDTSYDERYYLIMEWPWGQTLAERIAAGPITLAEQFHILKDVATALALCHERGVIHRNLTPDAIYLTNDGRAKVGDFDFAKMPAISRSLSLTGVFPVAGRHVSPEVAYNVHDVDARADIYSLGAVWYDMLFCPGADALLERKRIAQAPVSRSGQDLLRCMLAEQRINRIKSMVKVGNRLEKFAGDSL
jgi:serine/threonine protein kinase